MKPHAVQIVDSTQIGYLMNIAETLVTWGWRIEIYPYPQISRIGLTIYCEIEDYPRIIEQLYAAIPNYNRG